MKKILASTAIAVAALASVASANASGFDVGVNVGSMGVGPQIGYTIVDNKLDVRLATGFLSYNHSETSSQMDYSGSLKLRNAALLADYHPFSGSFRLTAGVVINKNKLTLDGRPTPGTTYTTNDGYTYTAEAGDSVNATVDFRNAAPYVGIGWGRNDMKPGLHFTADIGAMFQGSPRSTINITTSNPAAQAQADAYAANAKSQLNSDLKRFKVYPVVQAGVLYRF